MPSGQRGPLLPQLYFHGPVLLQPPQQFALSANIAGAATVSSAIYGLVLYGQAIYGEQNSSQLTEFNTEAVALSGPLTASAAITTVDTEAVALSASLSSSAVLATVNSEAVALSASLT